VRVIRNERYGVPLMGDAGVFCGVTAAFFGIGAVVFEARQYKCGRGATPVRWDTGHCALWI